MKKNIKVVYYVDTRMDFKSTICAYPSDVQYEEIIASVSKEIFDAFKEVCHFKSTNETTKIVEDIICKGCGEYGDYEFGVEEIPLYER